MARDPIGYEGSKWNLYEYANSSPLIFVDSSGLESNPSGKPGHPPSNANPLSCRPPCSDTVTIISSHTTSHDLQDWINSGIGGNIYPGIGSTYEPGGIVSLHGTEVIARILERRPKECGCVQTLNISGHGIQGWAGITFDPGGTYFATDNDAAILERIGAQLCEGATVNLQGCGTASPPENLQEMADLLGTMTCGCSGSMTGPNECHGKWICKKPTVFKGGYISPIGPIPYY